MTKTPKKPISEEPEDRTQEVRVSDVLEAETAHDLPAQKREKPPMPPEPTLTNLSIEELKRAEEAMKNAKSNKEKGEDDEESPEADATLADDWFE